MFSGLRDPEWYITNTNENFDEILKEIDQEFLLNPGEKPVNQLLGYSGFSIGIYEAPSNLIIALQIAQISFTRFYHYDYYTKYFITGCQEQFEYYSLTSTLIFLQIVQMVKIVLSLLTMCMSRDVQGQSLRGCY